MTSDLRVSLPGPLQDALKPLPDLLPTELRPLVVQALRPPAKEIHYELLVKVSTWAHSEDGKDRLKAADLQPNDYLLIALLAGTKTSPSSHLPPPEPKPEPWEIAQDEKSQKGAIAALVNVVFSVVGVGAAAWWASKNTGWKDEWRVLLSFAAAIVVAVAEGGIYYIHTSRKDAAAAYRKKQRVLRAERLHRKFEKETPRDKTHEEISVPEISGTDSPEVSPTVETLRQRRIRPADHDEEDVAT